MSIAIRKPATMVKDMLRFADLSKFESEAPTKEVAAPLRCAMPSCVLPQRFIAPFLRTHSPNEMATTRGGQNRPYETLCEKRWKNCCARRLQSGGFLQLFGNYGAVAGSQKVTLYIEIKT